MNVLFLTLLDFDSLEERGIYTDLAQEFLKNGNKLFIVSPFEKNKNKKTELKIYDNYEILKLEIGNIQKTNLLEKVISTLTLENIIKKGIKKYFSKVKFDLIIYSTPPITLYSSIKYVKQRDNSKTYLLLKDIFPQNAVDLEMMKKSGVKGLIYKYFRNKEKKLYKISDYIGCMSQANVNYLLQNNKELERKKVEICPNSIAIENRILKDCQKKEIKLRYKLPLDKKIFVYGGNLGKPQAIDFLVNVLLENEEREDSFILIVGSGTEYNKLQKKISEENLKKSILYKQIPKEDYENLVKSCDVGIILLDRRFTIPNFPSRILSYMQASLPIIAATDKNTDIGEIIEKNKFGYWCESKNSNDFMIIMDKLCNENKDIKVMGKNSFKFLEENYTVKKSYEIIMKHFI